jgi:spermidine synthase
MATSKQSYILDIVVFISGAVVMILELTGSRILAPFIGNSLPVWSGLIGIILGSLSLGYLIGGRLADKKPSYTTLSIILFFSSFALFSIPLLSKVVLPILTTLFVDVRVNVTVASLLLFALPSVLLGMVAPYAIRLRLENIATSGTTAGRLYALSTVGSIVGTFLAGFFLIAFLGSQTIMYLLAGVMILLTLLLVGKDRLRLLALFLVAGGIVCGLDYLYGKSLHQPLVDTDTKYNRAQIYEYHDPDSRIIRELLLGNVRNSATYMDTPELVYEYTKYYRLVDHFVPGIQSVLVIGGGGYSYPKDFLHTHPNAALTVVEIDEGLTNLAKQYFNFQPNENTTIYHEDGRTFLNREAGEYDAIVLDAFSDYQHPFQLTTKEALTHMANILKPQGVVISNVASSILGKQGKVLRAEYYTYKAVFPHVAVFPVSHSTSGLAVQNIMIVASKKPLSLTTTNGEFKKYLETAWQGQIPQDVTILTDDFAPVEYYAMQSFQ